MEVDENLKGADAGRKANARDHEGAKQYFIH